MRFLLSKETTMLLVWCMVAFPFSHQTLVQNQLQHPLKVIPTVLSHAVKLSNVQMMWLWTALLLLRTELRFMYLWMLTKGQMTALCPKTFILENLQKECNFQGSKYHIDLICHVVLQMKKNGAQKLGRCSLICVTDYFILFHFVLKWEFGVLITLYYCSQSCGTLEKEIVMTSDEASIKNRKLPKGFIFVPVNCLPKEKRINEEASSVEPVEPDG